MLNPWVIIASGLLLVGIGGGAYYQGRVDGNNAAKVRQASDDAIRRETSELAQMAAATEIRKIQVIHTTIRQKAETVIREKIQYRDCVNDPSVVRLLDDARAGSERVAPGGGQLSDTGASSSPVVR
jgi:hypothetical protein